MTAPSAGRAAPPDAAGRLLIVVRHSLPHVEPSTPPPEWHLSEEGHRRCRRLAVALRPHAPQVILSSPEPKALETARLLAGDLGLPVDTCAGVREHDLGDAGWMPPQRFEAAVGALFRQPGLRVLGEESGDEALARFGAGVGRALDAHPGENLLVVTHGRVMALFLGRAAGVDPFPLWKGLGMPAYALLSVPDLALVRLVPIV